MQAPVRADTGVAQPAQADEQESLEGLYVPGVSFSVPVYCESSTIYMGSSGITIHDAVLVPESKAAELKAVVLDSFDKFTGFGRLNEGCKMVPSLKQLCPGLFMKQNTFLKTSEGQALLKKRLAEKAAKIKKKLEKKMEEPRLRFRRRVLENNGQLRPNQEY